MGIEGRKLLTPEDDYEALKEFNQAYEGTTSATEEMHLEYQRLLARHQGLREKRSTASAARSSAAPASRERAPRGVLLLRAAGARQGAGRVHRRGRDDALVLLRRRDARRSSRSRARSSSRSARRRSTPRVCTSDDAELIDAAREGAEAHQEHVSQAGRCAGRRQARR